MHYVIIGNGIAGISAAQVLRDREESATITIISEETRYFYARTALMWAYMRQLTNSNMEPFERWYWEENRFELVFDRVVSIDSKKHVLDLEKGSSLSYDKLLLATGSRANKFGWPGQDLDGVCTFTTMGDLEDLQARRSSVSRAVVVGGGLVGIELVEIFLHDKVEVTYLIREPWYFDLALSQAESDLVKNRLEKHGCRVLFEDEIGEIKGSGGKVSSVTTTKGEEVPCDCVGLAVGVHPRIDLARESGLDTGRGIVVDRSFQTSAPDIWAAGDCIEMRDQGQDKGIIQALWYTSNKHGIAAARAMLGDPVTYDQGIPYNSAQFLFLDYVTVGWMKKFKPQLTEYEKVDNIREHGVRIACNDEQVVKGFSLIGPRYDSRVLMKWIEERRSLDYVRKKLPRAGFNEEFARVSWKGLV